MGELSVTEEDYVIAVDGGLSYCGLLHVEPDLIIGDCDSMTEQEKLAVDCPPSVPCKPWRFRPGILAWSWLGIGCFAATGH